MTPAEVRAAIEVADVAARVALGLIVPGVTGMAPWAPPIATAACTDPRVLGLPGRR